MSRVVLWVVLGLVLAGGAVFLLQEGDDTGAVDSYGALAEDDAPESSGPALQASGRRVQAQVAEGVAGSYTITGTVRDEEGQPVADVPIEVRRTANAYNPSTPETYVKPVAERIRTALASMQKPRAEEKPLVAESRSGADGSFTISLTHSGYYEVAAVPAAPSIGTYDGKSVYASHEEEDASLYVLPGTELRGRVIDTAERPVAGVISGSWWKSLGPTSHRWKHRGVDSDPADGGFVFPAVPVGTLRLSVRLANGRTISGIAVDTPHEGTFVIRIDTRTSAIEGTVTDGDGNTIAAAIVLLSISWKKDEHHLAGSVSIPARTNAEGLYRIDDAPLGKLTRVRTTAEGFLGKDESGPTASWHDAEIEAGKTLTVDLTVVRGGSISGIVTEEGTSKPLANALVALYPLGARGGGAQNRFLAPVSTDAEGRYRIDSVARGRYLALCEKEGWYLPQIRPTSGAPGFYSPGSGPPAALSVAVTEEGQTSERNLVLARGLPVTGRVLDAKGEGVAEAQIKARGYGLQQRSWQWGINPRNQAPLATSGPDGAFEAKGLPPHTDWVLYATKEGYAGAYAKPFALAEGGAAPKVELTLHTGATLRGTVTGLDAASMASAQIGCWGQASELSQNRGYKKLDPSGAFELTGIPPGDWTLNVWMNGRAGTQKNIRGLSDGEVRAGLVLEMKAGVEVSGLMVDADGEPVANTSVGLRGLGQRGSWVNGQTDAKGRFVFRGVEAGRVQLMMFAAGVQKTLGAAFDAPKADVRVVYTPDVVVALKGRVLDPAGDPVPVAQIQIRASGGGSGSSPRMQMNGAQGGADVLNGVFETTVTGPAPYRATVSNARDANGKPLNFLPSSTLINDASEDIVIRLEVGKEVRGTLVDTQGKPIAGAPVRVGRQSVSTDKAGAFVLSGQKAGKVSVQIGPVPGYASPPTQQVETGGEALRITLEKGLQIKGRVEGPEGKPVNSGWITAKWAAVGSAKAGQANAQLQPGGTFTVDGLPEGVSVTVSVQVWNQGGGVAYAPTQVEGVQPGTDDVVLRMGSGLTLEGTVVSAEGKPVSGVYVGATSVEKPQRQSGWVQTDDKGRWKLAGLKAAAYEVRVMQQGSGASSKPTRVDAPASGVRLTLPKTVTLSGRLAGVSEEDAPKWRILIINDKGQRKATAQVRSDGTWSAGPLADEGKVYVGAHRTDQDSYAKSGLVRPGRKDLVLRLQQGRSISGTIEMNGEVESRRMVVARGQGWQAQAVIGEDGSFTIRGLPPGTYTLSAYVGSSRGSKSGVQAGATGVVLSLEQPK